MQYRIEEQVFARVPAYARAVVIARNAKNTCDFDVNLDQMFRAEISRVERELIDETHPKLAAWTNAYKSALPEALRRSRPSVSALVRRIRTGKGASIPFISPIVCISNLLALRYLTPSGPVDRDLIEGDLALGIADGSENFEAIGEQAIGNPYLGEVIYYDTATRNVLCRAWNSRGGKAAWITSTTSQTVIDIDSLLDVMSMSHLKEATLAMAELLQTHCGAETEIRILTKQNSLIEFS